MEGNKAVPKAPSVQAPAAPSVQAPAAPKLESPKFEAPKLAAPKAPAKPELTALEQAEIAKMHKPYIDLGKAIASGKNTWA
jgi:hypothetical protein